MSLSSESTIYHLRRDGWIESEFVGDFSNGPSVERPFDCVRTVRCYEKLSHYKSEPEYSATITWETDDNMLLNNLLAKFGDKPDWYGYSKMRGNK